MTECTVGGTLLNMILLRAIAQDVYDVLGNPEELFLEFMAAADEMWIDGDICHTLEKNRHMHALVQLRFPSIIQNRDAALELVVDRSESDVVCLVRSVHSPHIPEDQRHAAALDVLTILTVFAKQVCSS